MYQHISHPKNLPRTSMYVPDCVYLMAEKLHRNFASHVLVFIM